MSLRIWHSKEERIEYSAENEADCRDDAQQASGTAGNGTSTSWASPHW